MLALILVAVTAAVVADPASDQLLNFRNNTNGPIGILSTSFGAPIEIMDTVTLNSPLIDNAFFMESMSHFVRERIPERVVHVKGTGAYGYLEITHDVTDICKAKLFSRIGKKTPLFARFSPSTIFKGGPDTALDSRGFAIKFYTEEGNFDLLAFNTPMFALKDPNFFQPLVRCVHRNPVTNLNDTNMLWDFVTLRPESTFWFMFLFADNGIPDGFRYFDSFGIHTYQIYNKRGESFFVRFHILPDAGVRNLVNREEIIKLAGTDPDYAGRDLYNEIERGYFPSWTMSMQVLSTDDVKKADFDVFDLTKILPLKKYPLWPVGKIVLNKNPSNSFAEVEQVAYCPGNVVPGIVGAPDKLFQARRFSYRDAQIYRLGVNFNNILVNRPLGCVLSYDRDGVAPVGYNGDGAPNFFPNSHHGPFPYIDKNRPKLISVIHDDSYNFDQAAEFYNEMTIERRNRFIDNIVYSVGQTHQDLQQRAVKLFFKIHPDFGYRVRKGLARIAASYGQECPCSEITK